MSEDTEEVLASLLGALIVRNPRDSKSLEYKALCHLVVRGVSLSDASRIVETNIELLRKAL